MSRAAGTASATMTWSTCSGRSGRAALLVVVRRQRGSNRSKCRVGRCDLAGGEIGVFDSEEARLALPARSRSSGRSRPASARAPAYAGAGLPAPGPAPSLPDWGERCVGTGKPKASLHNAKLAPGGDRPDLRRGCIPQQGAHPGGGPLRRPAGVPGDIDDARLRASAGISRTPTGMTPTEVHLR